jgi:hypothetical protein
MKTVHPQHSSRKKHMQYVIKTYGGRRPMRPVFQRQVVVVQQQSPRLPGFMTRLSIVCDGDGGRKHPLPVRVGYAGPALSAKGQLVAKYGPCPLCGKAHFMAVNSPTGKPFCLWTEN